MVKIKPSTRGVDLTGKRFGRWTVIRYCKTDAIGNLCWEVICRCGTKRVLAGTQLRQGKTKSCGCRIAEITSKVNYVHGMYRSREYKSWLAMRTRCKRKKSLDYKRYGARGITVCKRWLHSFELFFKDMGKRPHKMSLERINNSKGYCKSNCRWATVTEQARNRRSNKYFMYKGKLRCLPEIAELHGLCPRQLKNWIYRYTLRKAIAKLLNHVHA